MIFDLEPHGERLARSHVLVNGDLVESAAPARIDMGTVRCYRLLALSLQFVRGAEARISLAFPQETLGVFGVNSQPLRLAVGTISALLFTCPRRAVRFRGTFVPIQTQPAQVFDELPFVARLRPLHIGVFNARTALYNWL